MGENKEDSKFEEKLEPKIKENKIKKTIKIQQVIHGNKQSFYVRIPMEIVDELEIKKGDKFTFEIELAKNPKDHKVQFRLGD